MDKMKFSKLNKKASSIGEYSFLIIFGFIIIIALFIFTTMATGRLVDLISTGNLGDNIITQRVFFSKNSIFYTDSITGRTFSNIVDHERFSDKTIKELFGDKLREHFGMQIVLSYNGKEEEIYYNKDFYMLAKSRTDIYGTIDYIRIVNVKNGAERFPGNLEVHAVYKKR